MSTFYAVTTATCFTGVGLWWAVAEDKKEWFKNEVIRRFAGGVYASFLIPALMSLSTGTDQRDYAANYLAGNFYPLRSIRN